MPLDAGTIKLIRASIITLYTPEIIVEHLPPLVNAERLSGKKFKIFGDAGMLSGVASEWLQGDSSNKRGIVSSELWGYWDKITGDISWIFGCATGLEGDATGKSGNISGIYGNFSKCRGDMSGISGYITGLEGYFTGITATADEIREALKGGF